MRGSKKNIRSERTRTHQVMKGDAQWVHGFVNPKTDCTMDTHTLLESDTSGVGQHRCENEGCAAASSAARVHAHSAWEGDADGIAAPHLALGESTGSVDSKQPPAPAQCCDDRRSAGAEGARQNTPSIAISHDCGGGGARRAILNFSCCCQYYGENNNSRRYCDCQRKLSATPRNSAVRRRGGHRRAATAVICLRLALALAQVAGAYNLHSCLRMHNTPSSIY